MKLITRLILILACFTAAFTAGTLARQAPAAATVTAASSQASHTSLWWDGATCRAFGHGRFGAMVRDSRHADTYLRVDVALWAHDSHRHASRRVLEVDRGYVGLDCAGSYGL